MNNKYYIECAKEIGDFLLSERKESDNGIYWNSFRPGAIDEEVEATSTLDLYSGNPGISLFFLMLYDATEDSKYLDVVGESLKWAFHENSDKQLDFGLYNGAYGLLMVASKYMKLSGNKRFLNESNEILTKLSIKSKRKGILAGDLISGHSGSVVSLMHIVQDNIITVPEELLNFHTKSLFEFIVFRNGRLYFSQEDEMPLSGFSHGQSGVAHVIAQLGLLYNEKWMLYLSQHLLESELEMADSEFHFPDYRSGLYFQEKFAETTFEELTNFRNEAAEMFAWCHGIPGIAMGNLEVHQCLQTAQSNQRLAQFKDAFLLKFDTEKIHQFCLCHGQHGNILFLVELNKTLRDEKLDDLIKAFSFQAFEKLKENGFHFKQHHYFNDLSLMNGISGVGYYYLKMGSENMLFDVLTPKIPNVELKKRHGLTFNFTEFIEKFARREFLFFDAITIADSAIIEEDIIQTILNVIPTEKKQFWDLQVKISQFRFYHSLDYRSFLVKEAKRSKQLITDFIDIDFEKVVHYENNLADRINDTNYIYTTNGHTYRLLKVSDLEFEILSSTTPSEMIISILSSLNDSNMASKFKNIVVSMIKAELLFLKNN